MVGFLAKLVAHIHHVIAGILGGEAPRYFCYLIYCTMHMRMRRLDILLLNLLRMSMRHLHI